MNCKNCETIIDSKFCPNCGQNIKEQPVALNYFLDEIDKKYNPLKTNKSLINFLWSPALHIKNFLDCKRVNVLDPISSVLITAGLYLLVSGYINPLMPKEVNAEHEYVTALEKITTWYNNNLILFSFIIIIPCSFLTWRLFRKRRFNYAEHIVLNTYMTSLGYIIACLDLILLFIQFKTKINFYDSIFSNIFTYMFCGLIFSKVVEDKYSVSGVLKYIFANGFIMTLWIIFVLMLILGEVVK